MELLYIDLFSGAGGTSTGVECARIDGVQCAKVIACVNHDKNAIASHAANHPDALHFTEDIRTLELSPLVAHVKHMRTQYPDALLVLWASLECTNFSRAKGGLPRDADSRTLGEHLFRYIESINPDYLHIENVEEFMSWGDLDTNGKPLSRDNGKSYNRWVENIKSYGYNFEYRILNSANFGAYTSRKRFFAQFAKDGLPISWPEPTHSKTGSINMFETLHKWKPVKDVLDFSDEGISIFTRKKPLAEKTLERIYAGLIKFVSGGKENFLAAYYGNGHNCTSVNKPCPTITTKDRLSLITPRFIDQQFGNSKPSSINKPLGAITTNPKYNLVTVNPWIMDTNFGNVGSSINEPSRVITANRKWFYLMNPQYMNAGIPVTNPCFTLIAHMDKAPPYLVVAENGKAIISIYESDTEFTGKIKEFMSIYSIVDIKMRMLKIPELKMIMGFSENYMLIGTQAEQKKYIGNAVEVTMAKVLCEAVCMNLLELTKMAV